MSQHKTPLTDLEREGLEAHRLPIGTPSQSADCFRNGIRFALQKMEGREPDFWMSENDSDEVISNACKKQYPSAFADYTIKLRLDVGVSNG